MADSKRQKLVEAIVARMKTILVANGFTTDIGATVEDSRVNWQEEELPAISVFDLPANAESAANPANTRHTIWMQPIQIRVSLIKGTDAKNARNAIKDIWKAVRSDPQWTLSSEKVAMYTIPTQEGFTYPPDSFEIIGIAVEFNVVYLTAKFNAEA